MCNGINTYFFSKYGTRSRKQLKKRKARGGGKALTKLRTESNQLRSELRKTKKSGKDPQAIILKILPENSISSYGNTSRTRKQCPRNKKAQKAR